MKVYCSTRHLLADVERLLAANRPATHCSPLGDVTDLLCRGRHYAWAGIFLAVDSAGQNSLDARGTAVNKVMLPGTRSKVLVSMKLASRELGVLSVESESSFTTQDRVLLEAVANILARFLAGRGKYLVRKARMAIFANVQAENREPATDN